MGKTQGVKASNTPNSRKLASTIATPPSFNSEPIMPPSSAAMVMPFTGAAELGAVHSFARAVGVRSSGAATVSVAASMCRTIGG